MAEEDPQFKPAEQTPEEELDIDPTLFRWNAMAAPPWDPGTYYFFLMPDPIFYDSMFVEYPLEAAEKLHEVVSNFCAASSYVGLSKTADRLSSDFIMQGQDPGEALLIAAAAAQIIQAGLAQFLPDFTHVLIHVSGERETYSKKPFPYPTSPMHTWAFVQACEFLEKDLLPMFEESEGSDSYPFGELAEVREAIKFIHELMAKDIQEFMNNLNPYKCISDLRSLADQFPDESEPEPEQPPA